MSEKELIKNQHNEIRSFQKEFKKRKDTYKRIIEWKELADQQPNEIRRFIFRWISFNGLYSASYGMLKHEKDAERDPEWKKIDFFCDNFILKNDILASQIYSDNKKKTFEELIKEKSNYMGTYLNKMKNMKTKGGKAKYMVLIAYKIRCRLFHGEKNPLLEDNKMVVKTADEVITPILNYILFN